MYESIEPFLQALWKFIYIYIIYLLKMKNKKQTKSTNNYLLARTCDSGCVCFNICYSSPTLSLTQVIAIEMLIWKQKYKNGAVPKNNHLKK